MTGSLESFRALDEGQTLQEALGQGEAGRGSGQRPGSRSWDTHPETLWWYQWFVQPLEKQVSSSCRAGFAPD